MRFVVYRLMLVLLALLASTALRAGSYWNTDYDSLRRTLPTQLTDKARLRTLVHLLDLVELTEAERRKQALPLLDELLALNQKLHQLDSQPYRLLRNGLKLWVQGNNDKLALAQLHQAIEVFDAKRRPIPRLLIDLAPLYNRLHQSDERFAYFQRKLAYYHQHGPYQNEAACYLVLAGSYKQRGNFNQAVSYMLRAADLLQRFDRLYYLTELTVVGLTYTDWGNLPRARTYLKQVLALEERYRIQGLRRVVALQALAALELRQQAYAAALSYAEQSLQIAYRDSLVGLGATAHALVLKAGALMHHRSPAEARPFLLRAQQLADSLRLPLSGRLGEFPLEATWAQYHELTGQWPQAEARWLTLYHQATAGNNQRIRQKALEQLIRFYDAQRRPAQLQRYTHTYLALLDSVNAAQARYHVARYETERQENAQNARIAALAQAQAVQALRLRQRGLMLGLALIVTIGIAALGAVLYRQLRLHQRMLRRLRQTQAELVAAEKWAFVGEVSAGMAHELQNPLNFMKRFAEVSTRMIDSMNHATTQASSASLEQEIVVGLKRNLQEISQHGLRASAIITSMLEHARTGTGQRQTTDLNALITEYARLAHEAFQHQPSAMPVAFNLDLDPQLPALQVVPQDLGRVLLNLLTNAFYAVQQRAQNAGPGYAPTVTVHSRHTDGQGVEIRIRDNGPGIPADVRERLFKPFFTTKPVGEGTGLGLSMSHDIVTKGHGGTLRVETQEEDFTVFIICLPQA